jgi:SAM-dependent methyltransferase
MKSRIGVVTTLLKKKRNPSEIFTSLALRRALAGCEKVLDVGCGVAFTLHDLGMSQTTGVDAYAPSIEKARQAHTHNELILGDVRNLMDTFQPKSFDACVAMDVIEHLPKPDGLKLMAEMESIARRKVVFLTPNGFLPQGNTDGNEYQRHYSGWEPAEMRQHGYEVSGLLGPKSWRGEYHRLKYKPAALWAVASLVSHVVWTGWQPEKSAAILCVKTI